MNQLADQASLPQFGQSWRNKKTEQDYQVGQVAEQIFEIDRPRSRYTQAGALRRINGEPLHLCSKGYYIKSGAELGTLVFYTGETGDWARTLPDFLSSFTCED